MRERFDKILGQLKEINAKLTKRNRILIIGGIVAVLLIAVVGAVILNSTPYDLLYTGVTQQDAKDIMGVLQESGVSAKYDSDGNISVPKEQVDELRAQLAVQGYPKSGFTYSTFSDNVDMMSTDFEKNTYKLYELQDRLAATIRRFDGVSDATVIIAAGQDSKFVYEKDKVEPSASVALVTKGNTLDEDQVRGIQRLVAKSIPKMKEENVLITDSTGRDLTALGEMSQTGSARLKQALEHDMENTMQAKVMHLLSPIFGEDAVRVTVKCTMDVDKKIKEILTYLPATDDNKGVMSHQDSGVEIIGEGTASAGVVGTDTNAQVPVYPNITTDGNEIYYRDDKSFDYLVSQVKEQIQSDSGVVTDLSVSVVVDGQNLSQAELAEMKRLVAITAGIPTEQADEKVAVFKATFAEEETVTVAQSFAEMLRERNIIPILIGIVILLVLIGILVMVLLKKRKARKAAKEAAEQAAAKEAEEAAMLAELHARDQEKAALLKYAEENKSHEEELRDEVRNFADENPEISAQLIKSWLRGGDGNGDQ